IAELAVGTVQTRSELRRQLEDEPGALGGHLAEARIGHLRELAGVAGSHPGAARGLLIEQAHLAEELPLVEVGEDHLVAFLVLDHDLDGAIDHVIEHVGQVTGVDQHGFGWHRADAAVTQESIDRRNVAQRSDILFHVERALSLSIFWTWGAIYT